MINKTRPGMLTGYYEPLLHGSRTKQGAYVTPIYKRPSDLVTVIPETHRGAVKRGRLTHVRKTETGTEPYYTRAQIDQGALKDKGLELLYFKDPIEVFFMQIQGSGRVQLTDGKTIRVQYDGKNGHPYSSIARYLIEKALLAADKVSMGTLITWLKADPERAKPVIWYNESYVFFREIKASDDQGAPLGAMNVPLTSGRSLGVRSSLSRSRNARLRERAEHAACPEHVGLQSPDDRAGRGLRHQGPGARRHLLRLGRGGRQDRRQYQASGEVLRAGAQRARRCQGRGAAEQGGRADAAMSRSGRGPAEA